MRHEHGNDFFNRTSELNTIRNALRSDRAELVVMYGRRGVGKSELLVRAIPPHSFYYQATAQLMQQQLGDLTQELNRVADGQAIIGRLESFPAVLAAVTDLAQRRKDEPFVFVIDEFPYLAQADPGVETTIQKWWDTSRASTPNLKVFLAGSHVSWMHEHTLDEHGPLQNRRTRQIDVAPLDYLHAADFYPHFSAVDKVRAFAIWGGLPRHLRDLDSSLDLWESIRQTLLDPDSRLFVEPDWLRFTDLRADRVYTSLVRVIAMGQHTPGDIAKAVGRNSATDISAQLGRLVEIGIVARVNATTSRVDARSPAHYYISDPFLAFWYRFIDSYRNMIRRGQADAVLARIRLELDLFVSQYVFEGVCREWLWLQLGQGNLSIDQDIAEIGLWWGGAKGNQDEIDVVALSIQRETVIVGECKWTNAPMDMRDLSGLRLGLATAQKDLNPVLNPWRICFARGGFHPDLVAEAAHVDNRIVLVDPDQLYTR